MSEKEQLIFRDKKQFASNGFDFVQKQRNQRKRQDMFNEDEKRVRNGDRPFTKVKRSNRDMLDQNELQTYASLEKMLHKAIFAIQQLKKKGNTNTSYAPKQQHNFSSLSNSDLKTNVFSFDKRKAVKPTSKAHSTRCFKCHRIGHYANKFQNQKPLVTLENDKVETVPEKEEFSDLSPIFDDYAHEPMAVLKSCEHKNLFSCQSESILDESCLQLNILQPENPSSFELISQFEKDSENVLNKDEFSGPLNALDIGAYVLGLGSFVSMQEGPDEEQNSGHQANQERSSSIQKLDQTQDLKTNIFEEGENDRTQIEHRPVQIMDTAQGVISRQTQQVKTDGRARIHFGRA
uniref:CCHC-type domain-containing protein n=1 Tax=Brassica oleracea var. oleracea TaxID=109376 RepID=A0A0D3BX70_BRAOL